jgi:hypothetical protein
MATGALRKLLIVVLMMHDQAPSGCQPLGSCLRLWPQQQQQQQQQQAVRLCSIPGWCVPPWLHAIVPICCCCCCGVRIATAAARWGAMWPRITLGCPGWVHAALQQLQQHAAVVLASHHDAISPALRSCCGEQHQQQQCWQQRQGLHTPHHGDHPASAAMAQLGAAVAATAC